MVVLFLPMPPITPPTIGPIGGPGEDASPPALDDGDVVRGIVVDAEVVELVVVVVLRGVMVW